MLVFMTMAGVAVAGDLTIDLGRGPVTVFVPASYDPGVPTPLVLLLHGYGSDGALQEAYMRFLPLAEERGFLYAHPDGTQDILGLQFWNATDSCCDLFNTGVDDSGYLAALIDAVKAELNVDESRTYLIGHSNGGFMSYRMACDHPETIAAIASLAGATWEDPGRCDPGQAVHTLQIHGTDDETILFDGGCLFPFDLRCHPGAIDTIKQWAGFNLCDPVGDTSADPLDLDLLIPGDETVIGRVDQGCSPGGSGEIWVIRGGSHVPALTDDFGTAVIDYLMAHPKP